MEKTDKNGDNSIISGIAVSDVKWDTHERIQIVVSMPTSSFMLVAFGCVTFSQTLILGAGAKFAFFGMLVHCI